MASVLTLVCLSQGVQSRVPKSRRNHLAEPEALWCEPLRFARLSYLYQIERD
jgi:hypothetical protein